MTISPKANGRFWLDKKISVGNIIQIIIVAAAALVAVFAFGGRVAILETNVSAQTEQSKTFITEKDLKPIMVELREIRRRLDCIDKKLEKR